MTLVKQHPSYLYISMYPDTELEQSTASAISTTNHLLRLQPLNINITIFNVFLKNSGIDLARAS